MEKAKQSIDGNYLQQPHLQPTQQPDSETGFLIPTTVLCFLTASLKVSRLNLNVKPEKRQIARLETSAILEGKNGTQIP